MFKLFYINMLNVTYYITRFDELAFEYQMMSIRDWMQRSLISGWQIQRASDGVIIAQSKGATS